jgi:hypothetical protein
VGDSSDISATSKTPDLSDDKSDTEAAASTASAADPVEQIDFTVVFMKEKFEISLPSTRTVAELKQLLGLYFSDICLNHHLTESFCCRGKGRSACRGTEAAV